MIPFAARSVECEGKKSYPSESVALYYRSRIESFPGYDGSRGQLQPFLCSWCQRWHLGHPPDEATRTDYAVRRSIAETGGAA